MKIIQMTLSKLAISVNQLNSFSLCLDELHTTTVLPLLLKATG